MIHTDHVTIIDLILSLVHPIYMVGDICLDMTMVMLMETTTASLVIPIGITGTEMSALDITIMGMTG